MDPCCTRKARFSQAGLSHDGSSAARRFAESCCYSGIASPEPPNSEGKSFSFGKPSFMGSTVSA